MYSWTPEEQQEVLKSALTSVENSLWSHTKLKTTDPQGIPVMLEDMRDIMFKEIGKAGINQVTVAGRCRKFAEVVAKVRLFCVTCLVEKSCSHNSCMNVQRQTSPFTRQQHVHKEETLPTVWDCFKTR